MVKNIYKIKNNLNKISSDTLPFWIYVTSEKFMTMRKLVVNGIMKAIFITVTCQSAAEIHRSPSQYTLLSILWSRHPQECFSMYTSVYTVRTRSERV